MTDFNEIETEEGAERLHALRNLKVRQMSKAGGRSQSLSKQQRGMLKRTESLTRDNQNTSR